MSYENPTTVVDTESAKIRAAGMASFGQSIGGAITALGQGQREAAKERKKANLKEADDFIKYNDKYQQNIWNSTGAYEKATGLDVSSEASDILDGWATKGATLKAKRDRSDDPAERAKIGKEIAIYDKYLLGGGMGNSFSAISELQATIQRDGAPNKLGRVGGLSASSLDPEVYKDFLRLGQGGNKMTLSGTGGVYNEATGSYSPLGLKANFEGGGTYSSDQMSKGDLVYIPDMQEGVQEMLRSAGLYGESKKIDTTSPGFLNNFAKTDENGQLVYTTRIVDGKTIKYIDIDFGKFQNTLRGTYDASIVGYSEGAGDETSMGFREMKAYADDILDDIPDNQRAKFKELTGFGVDDLKLVSATGDYAQADTILSKESYENYQKALAAKKYLEVSNLVPGTIAPSPPSPRKGTEKERTQATQRDYLNQVTNSFAQGNTINDLYDSVINNPTSYNFTGDYAGGLIKGNDFIKEIENYDLKEMLDLNILPKNSSPKDRKEYIENAKNSLKASPNALIDFTIDSKSGASSSFGKILGEEKALIKLLLEIPAFAALEPMELQAKAKEMLKRRTKEGRNKKEINPFPQPFKPGTGGLQDLPSTS